MNILLQDLRYGFRLLVKSPGITTVAIITLALGIGATTAIFTFVNAALIRALPFHDPQQLVSISMTKGGEFSDMEASYPNYLDWRAQNTAFESIDGYSQSGGILYGAEPQLVREGTVSSNFFSTLGVNAALGRVFNQDDEARTQGSPVVLSYAHWQQMGGTSDVLGKVLQLDNGDGRGNAVVIGVLPREFEFAPLGDPQIYFLPPVKGELITRRNLHWFNVIGRLKSGVSLDQAHSNLDAISKHLAELYPQSNRDTGIKIVPLRDTIVGQVRPILLLLFAAAAFVLLIACANIANVLLAKAAGRTREIAVRAALGARRSRIIRQFLTESVLLAAIAGVAGVVLATWGVHALVQIVPPTVRQSMPFLNHLAISTPALVFTAVVSLVTGILFGLAPALRPVPVSLHAELSEDSRSAIGSRRSLRDVLVVAEVGVAAVLLIGAGLLLESLWRVAHVDPGFNRHNLLVMRFALPDYGKESDVKNLVFQREAEQKIAALPGVVAVGVADQAPMACGGCNTVRFLPEGQPNIISANQPEANIRDASPNYFKTLQAKLLRGRYFTEHDDEKAPNVVVINRTLERMFFNGDALGKHLTFTYQPNLPAQEIVGVIDDVNEGSLDTEHRPAIYEPVEASPRQFATLVVRTAGDPAAVTSAVRAALLAIEPRTAIFRVSTMDNMIANSTPMFLRKLPALLVGIFGALAVLLAAIGIYGVVSYSVAQRTREFGIRMALGARAADVLRLVMNRSVRMTIVGIVAGIVGAIIVARAASHLLFGVGAFDALTFAVAAVLIGGVALLASLVPALRAARLDPMDALRYE